MERFAYLEGVIHPALKPLEKGAKPARVGPFIISQSGVYAKRESAAPSA
jgi:hypothetical protein